MSQTTVYGIKNCDTIKKAVKWLQQQQIEFNFHDYRKDGLELSMLQTFADQLGMASLVNKRGTTYRQLDEQQKQQLETTAGLALLQQYPAIIKRPLLVHNNSYHLGFKAEQYQELFTS